MSPGLGQRQPLSVTGTTNICPVVDGISATPNEVAVGSSLALAGVAHDPDNGPSPLSYAWTATSGAFDNAASQAPSFTCTAVGSPTITLTVSDGDTTPGCPATMTTTVTCTPAGADAGSASDASDATVAEGGGDTGTADAADAALPPQAMVTTLDPGVAPIEVTINQGTAIGEGALNGATPSTLTNVAADPDNTQSTVVAANGDFLATGHVPDTAAGFCSYPDGGAPTRVSYVTGAKFESVQGSDPMVPMAPFYFPLVYTTPNTPSDNAFGGKPPIIGLFDWRPKDIDEALVAAESDDNGKTWYFMQTVLELNPDYTNPISGGYTPGSTNTGCPTTITSTNASFTSASGSQADDGWGHATVIQLPGAGNIKTGQFLYMLDRNTNDIPGTSDSIVDNAPLHRVINLTSSSNKVPDRVTRTTPARGTTTSSRSRPVSLVNTRLTRGPTVAVVAPELR